MITSSIRLLKGYPWFKRLNAKITYEILSKYINSSEWHFMNYGYQPKECENTCGIGTQTLQRFPMQMYHYLATKVPIEGQELLEIGSGRGGGAKYITQSLKPSSYTGMDIAGNAVRLANKLHVVPNLRFIQGSAESIPLPDNSIDVVLNVESCHGYGSVPQFLSETKRVLKPGGHLLLVDFRNSQENMKIFIEQLKESGLEYVEQENISQNVIQAIEAEDHVKTEMIKKLVPTRWQKLFSEFAGTVGSPFHKTLLAGTRQYYRFVLRKAAA
ncbi:MAG TPA: class I SAM-dependent methyltransferase [Chryseolinea sp.]|nr:class I SAM-dependent methyltransferase [Chryseolinea sp.]